MQGLQADNKRIARNTVFLYIRMIVVLLISFYTTRILLNVLGVEDYGTYNVVCGFVSLFGVLNVTFSGCISRFYNVTLGRDDEHEMNRVFTMAIIIQSILSIVVLLLVEGIGIWYINTKMVIPTNQLFAANIIFQFAAGSLIISILQTPFSALILSTERMDYYAIVNIIDVVLKLIIVYVVRLASFDKLILYGALVLVISITNFFMYFLYVKSQFKSIKICKDLDKSQFLSMLNFSGWSILDPIAYTMRGQGCNMVLNVFFGPILNAAYSISNQVANALYQFTSNVTTAFKPQLMQSFANGSIDRSIRLTHSMAKINFTLQTMVCIPIIIMINYILELWLGTEIPSYTKEFTILILIIRNVDNLQSPLSSLIQASGKIKLYMTLSSTFVMLSLPLSYLLMKMGFRPTSMYYSILFLTVTNLFICVKLVSKEICQFKESVYLLKVVLPCFLFFIIVCGVLFLCEKILPDSFGGLVIMCIISVCLSVPLSMILVLSREESQMIKDFVRIKILKK